MMEDNIHTKHLFRIQYVDTTYQLVNWTNDQLGIVYRDMNEGKLVTCVNKCIFRLADIRAITHLVPEPEPEHKEDDDEKLQDEETMVLTEQGAYEQEMYDLLVSQGIELGDKLGERRKTK